MSKSLFLYIVLCAAFSANAQALKPDNGESEVKFSIRNFGATVTGHFSGLEGKMMFDASNPAKASFDMSLDAASIKTGNNTRDSHLRKEEYFDVDKYPRIRFVSAKITGSKSSGFTASGKLTIRDTSKEISFPFTATPKEGGVLFEGSFTIDRHDYSIGGKSLVMSDNVTITLSVFAKGD